MNKIRVIDLLNKIANGEKVPLYIKYYNRIEDKKNIMMVCKENIIYKLDQSEIEFNDEVEIIEEEKKIPEKWNDLSFTTMRNQDDIEHLKIYIETIMRTQNEIIDYLESEVN